MKKKERVCAFLGGSRPLQSHWRETLLSLTPLEEDSSVRCKITPQQPDAQQRPAKAAANLHVMFENRFPIKNVMYIMGCYFCVL